MSMGRAYASYAPRTPRSGEPGPKVAADLARGSLLRRWAPALAALGRGAAASFVLAAVSACATPLPQVIPTAGDTFDVRYDRGHSQPTDIDAVAQGHCAGASLVDTQTRFDGFGYRTYRCPARQGGS